MLTSHEAHSIHEGPRACNWLLLRRVLEVQGYYAKTLFVGWFSCYIFILDILQKAETLHRRCPPFGAKSTLHQARGGSFFYTSYCPFCYSIAFRVVRSWGIMWNSQIFESFLEFSRVVCKDMFCFDVRSQKSLKPLHCCNCWFGRRGIRP